MSLPKSPSFHSQARRKAESAAVPIHNRNVKHNTAMNHVARSSFAPPVPPKDEPPRIAPAVTPVKEEDKKSLDILEKEWMLNDYLGLTPTPMSEGGLAQEYLPSNIEIDGRRGSRNMIIDDSAELVDIPDSSEGTLLATQIGAETRATKRDTVAVLMDDIIGGGKKRRNTQPIIVDRMRDPDETIHELLAIHKRATADFREVIAAAKTPKPENGKLGSFARCDCTGLKSTAKSHADGMIEHFKDFRLKNRKMRRREEKIEEVRRRYEEMVTANAGARRGDEL
ncbi:unnamed protein product [Alternaria alternata]